MSCLQVLLAVIFPPLAVIDRGCGSILIVFLLTCLGWGPRSDWRINHFE